MNTETVIKEKSLVLRQVGDQLKSLVKDNPNFVKSEFNKNELFSKTILVFVDKKCKIPEDILQKFERVRRSQQQQQGFTRVSLPKNSLKSSFKIPKVAKSRNESTSNEPAKFASDLCDEEGTFEDIDAEYEAQYNDILFDENLQTDNRENDKEEVNNENEKPDDSDCDEAKSEESCGKNNIDEYQQMIGDEEILDFEENDDDEEDDDGNFKRRRKSDKTDEVSEPKIAKPVNIPIQTPVAVAKGPQIPVTKCSEESKPSVPTISKEPRTTANFPSRAGVENKCRGNNDMPLDNILKQMQQPKDRMRIREKLVAIEDISHALNAEGVEEGFRLFCNKVLAFDPKDRCIQQLLEKIAFAAIKSNKFSRIHQLRKKIEESKIVASDFWNKFISEAVFQIQRNKDMQIRTMLKESYDYLLRNDVNITVKSTQHLLDIVAPRIEKPEFRNQSESSAIKPGITSNSNSSSKIIRLTSSNAPSRSNIPSHLPIRTSTHVPESHIPSQHIPIHQLPTPFPFQNVVETKIHHKASPILNPFQSISEPKNTPPQFTLPAVSTNQFDEAFAPSIPAQILAKCPFQGPNLPVLFKSDVTELGTPPRVDPVIIFNVPESAPHLDDRKAGNVFVNATASVESPATETTLLPYKFYEVSKFLTLHKPSYSKPENLGDAFTITEGPALNIQWQCPNVDIVDPRVKYRKLNKGINEKLNDDTKQKPSEKLIDDPKDKVNDNTKQKLSDDPKEKDEDPKKKQSIKILKEDDKRVSTEGKEEEQTVESVTKDSFVPVEKGNKQTIIEVTGGKQTVCLKTVESKVTRRVVPVVKKLTKKTVKKVRLCRNVSGRPDFPDDIMNLTIQAGEAIPAIQIIKNYNSHNNTRIVKPMKRKLVNNAAAKVPVKRIKSVASTE